MYNAKEMIEKLVSVMSVSGHEERGREELRSFFSLPFDEYIPHSSGTHVFIKRCNKENAPRLMIDAHFDEIGMIVTGILDGGFLSVANIGGLDRRILPAAEVLIYGKETIYGVIVSTPPHLQAAGDSKKTPKIDELRIDTGYSKEELEKIVEIGTPIGFYERPAMLGSGRVASRSLDNKACCTAAYLAAASLSPDEMEADLYVTLSAREEATMADGASSSAYAIRPDLAIVTDVTFATAPGVKPEESGKFGGGPVISLSAVTDRPFTDSVISLCKESHIAYGITVDATDTGTNATMLSLVGDGIPVCVISIPIGSMHTYNETVELSDIESTAALFAAILKSKDIFAKGEDRYV
ncbi:MAG: M20/M25/M40 family metallo-hydrolase [Clostridia bacterium]|nr:M20/M25/M40 family metallo-hydrolase [Clostridia bacterium]